MLDEPKPMREIHEIQEKIYEEQKGLSLKEKVAAIHKEAEEFKKKWGIKPKRVKHVA